MEDHHAPFLSGSCFDLIESKDKMLPVKMELTLGKLDRDLLGL